MGKTGIVWLRQDLRTADNPALTRAAEVCDRVVPVYIYAPEESGDWPPGAASRWWLHRSLESLSASLVRLGSGLILRRGPIAAELIALADQVNATHVFWNRLYEPAHAARDKKLAMTFQSEGLIVQTFNASLLFEPWEQQRQDGGPYKVFTPFWKACTRRGLPADPIPAPPRLPPLPAGLSSEPLAALKLLPSVRWDSGLEATWRPGEESAWGRLEHFLQKALTDYQENRDRPDLEGTSRLSPHLHFGEISPRQIVAAVKTHLHKLPKATLQSAAEGFLRQLGWREFSYHLLYHFSKTPTEPLDVRFTRFPWPSVPSAVLQAWQRGRTGIPIVDAGLRQLWSTGWMHNRVRMLVASFLTKHLLIPWQEGARWFWDTLVDADLANNTQGWQWVAGCGADAAPYVRIFNPVLQGLKFDPQGDYVRRWVPELGKMPAAWIHQPWKAPAEACQNAGLRLGKDYPMPIVDLAISRERALSLFEQMRRK